MSVGADGCCVGFLQFKVLLLPEDAVLSSEIGPQFPTGQAGNASFGLGIAICIDIACAWVKLLVDRSFGY